MTVADLERLFSYSYWANQKLFRVIAQLPPEQFTQTSVGAYGSIRNTLVHVMSAEWGWLDRCGGSTRGPALKADDYPTFESLTEQWSKVEASMRGFLAGLKDDDLARVVEFTLGSDKRSLSVQSILQHSVNHGAHHRGQVALLLRSLGHIPGNFDLLFYDFEMPS
jgi:uncharacterized damage-inducible protein DinB